MVKNKKINKVAVLCVITFLLAISTALLAYVSSSFLSTIIPANYVGIVFTVTYAISFLAVYYFSYYINYLGKFFSFVSLLIISLLSLLGIALVGANYISLLFYVAYVVANNVLFINLDVFIESVSLDEKTGRIRGLILTITNLGWLVSPVASGFLLAQYNYSFLFYLSSLIVIPVVIISFSLFDKAKYRANHSRNFKLALKGILKEKPLRAVLYLAFLLQVFYALMVIYTPVYLVNLGFDWTQIGLAFTIMLLPFVIFQYPAGWLADRYWGETEMMSAAVIIIALSTLGIYFFSSFWLIAFLLFMTRVGASIMEILRDSYFFKHVDAKDIELLSFFRNTTPLAYSFAPVIITVILLFLPMKFVFLILGIYMLTGLRYTLTMPDTK